MQCNFQESWLEINVTASQSQTFPAPLLNVNSTIGGKKRESSFCHVSSVVIIPRFRQRALLLFPFFEWIKKTLPITKIYYCFPLLSIPSPISWETLLKNTASLSLSLSLSLTISFNTGISILYSLSLSLSPLNFLGFNRCFFMNFFF